MKTKLNEKALRETQTVRAGCSKAEPKNLVPPQTPSRGRRTAKNFNHLEMVVTFSYTPSLVRIDAHNFELLWQQIHKQTNKHTHKHTHTHTHTKSTDRTDYITLRRSQVARSVTRRTLSRAHTLDEPMSSSSLYLLLNKSRIRNTQCCGV